MTRRENSQTRRKPYRQPADRVLVVCGGVHTEPEYFEGMRKSYRNAAVKIVVRKSGKAPDELVRLAMTIRDRDPESFDEVWCVFDLDDFDVVDALKLAGRGGIRLAISNPCFELWLLLHFENCTAAMTGYTQLRRRLRRHIADYDKGCGTFDQFRPTVPAAIDRAKALAPAGTEHLCNPATGVWALAGKFERPKGAT